MKKVEIYDFDGVFFIDPWIYIEEMFMRQDIPKYIKHRIRSEHGFTKEMLKNNLVRPFYNYFREEYFSQRLSIESIARLRMSAKTSHLVVASLNGGKTIDTLLRLSSARDIFELILCREDYNSKEKMFKHIYDRYNPDEVLFTTDTVSDIRIAQDFDLKMSINVVLSGADSKRDLLGYVEKNQIVDSFF